MSRPTLIFNPTPAEIAKSGADRVVREGDNIYTVENVDGTKISAKLTNPNDADVVAIVAAVRIESLWPADPSQLPLF